MSNVESIGADLAPAETVAASLEDLARLAREKNGTLFVAVVTFTDPETGKTRKVVTRWLGDELQVAGMAAWVSLEKLVPLALADKVDL